MNTNTQHSTTATSAQAESPTASPQTDAATVAALVTEHTTQQAASIAIRHPAHPTVHPRRALSAYRDGMTDTQHTDGDLYRARHGYAIARVMGLGLILILSATMASAKGTGHGTHGHHTRKTSPVATHPHS